MNATYFPGVPSDVQIHLGFRDQHAKTASIIFAEVQSLLASTGAERIITVSRFLLQ